MATECSDLEPQLMARTEEIAAVWYAALTAGNPAPLDDEKLKAAFEDVVRQLISLGMAGFLDRSAARNIGSGVAGLIDVQPGDFVTAQESLAGQLLMNTPSDLYAVWAVRVMSLLSELEAGFLAERARMARQFNLNDISKMSHDLKTPINSITGFSRVMLKGIDGPITEMHQQDLTSVFDAGQKLLGMINDLSQVWKRDAYNGDILLDSFDVANLLGDVLGTVQPILSKKNATLEIRCIGDLGAFQSEPTPIRWILLSLVLHAAKRKNPGIVSLTVGRQPGENGERLTFQITASGDWGIPIPSQNGWPVGLSDLALVVAQRFAQELGGTLDLGADGDLPITVSLPFRAADPDN